MTQSSCVWFWSIKTIFQCVKTIRSKWTRGLLVAAMVLLVGGAQMASAAPPRGKEVARTVRALNGKYKLSATMFGVWIGGRPLTTGALGEAQPGVPARTADHFRIGNVTETFTTTLLLQYVEQGRVSLNDPLSKWFPSLPGSHQVTLGMLARSTSGYAHYVTNPRFVKALYADPFKHWTPRQLINYGVSERRLFAPGTSWAFSDTNFVLLGEVLRRVGGRPLPQLLRAQIFDKLGLRHTANSTNSHMPSPVLHGYDSERGLYEDATFWNPSWTTNCGNSYSTLGDLGKWARALGSGSLLSPASHALQVGPQNVGLGPFKSDKFYYAMGLGVSNGWVLTDPRIPGYSGVIAYLPSKKIAIVIFSSPGPKDVVGVSYAQRIFNRIGPLLAPDQPPHLPG
jgi:D-alanyl-D-alanine carboxypeptidase